MLSAKQIVDIKEKWDKLRIRSEAIKMELKKSKDQMEKIHGTSDPVELKKIREKIFLKISNGNKKIEKLERKINKILDKYDA